MVDDGSPHGPKHSVGSYVQNIRRERHVAAADAQSSSDSSIEQYLEGKRQRARNVSKLDGLSAQERDRIKADRKLYFRSDRRESWEADKDVDELFRELRFGRPGDLNDAPDTPPPEYQRESDTARWQRRRPSNEEDHRKYRRKIKRMQAKQEEARLQEQLGAITVSAGKNDTPLGIASCLPPRRVFVVSVEAQSWAATVGIGLGSELVEINGRIASSMNIQTFTQAMRSRPLELSVLPPDGSVFEVSISRNADWDGGFRMVDPPLQVDEVDKRRGYKMQDGDLILAVNRKPVNNYDDYSRLAFPLQRFKLTLQKQPRFDVKVVRDDDGDGGFRLSDPPLMIAKVAKHRQAALYPMQKGNAIVAVDNTKVTTYDEYVDVAHNLREFTLTLLEPIPVDDNFQGAQRVSVRVTVISAQGLSNRDTFGSVDAYCVCEVPGVPEMQFQTPTATNTQAPYWNYSQKFVNMHIADTIHFTVWDDDAGQDDPLGEVVLRTSQFYPDGFEGDAPLLIEGEAGNGTLTLMIEVIGEHLPVDENQTMPIIVSIVSAKGLRIADKGSSDPYCTCKVLGKKALKFKTRVCKETLNPFWNHSHEFKEFSPSDELQFHVLDADTGVDDSLGHASLSYKQIFPFGFHGKIELLETGLSKGYKAILNIKVQVIQAVPIEVTIIGAENLKKADVFGSSDPYCVCEVLGRRGMNFKTPVVDDSTNPVWNTRFTFNEFEPRNGLDFTIWDQDIAGAAELLGSATLEPEMIMPSGFYGRLPINASGSNSTATTQAIAAALPSCGSLYYLDLQGNQIGFEGAKAELFVKVDVLGRGERPKPEDSESSADELPSRGIFKREKEIWRDVDDSDHSSAASSLFESFFPGERTDKRLDQWIIDKENELEARRKKRGEGYDHELRTWAAMKIQRFFRRNIIRRMRDRDARWLEEQFKNLGQTVSHGTASAGSTSKSEAVRAHRQQHGAAQGWGKGVSVAQIRFLTFTIPHLDEHAALRRLEDAIATCLQAAGGLGTTEWQWGTKLVPGTSYGFLLAESMALGQEMLNALGATTRKPFMCRLGKRDILFEVEPSRHFREWQVGRHGTGMAMINNNVEREVAAAGAKWRMRILQGARRRIEVHGPAHQESYRPRQWDVEVVMPERHGAQHVVYHCRHNGGLGNCLLMFLGLAQRAELVGYDFIHFDGAQLPMYGDITHLFPPLPTMHMGVPKPATNISSRWGSLGNNRGSQERRGPLLDKDIEEGRLVAGRHLHLHEEFEEQLLDFAAEAHLPDALGVHIRRTDKKVEAPSNMAMTPSEAATQVARRAHDLRVNRVFLASDDAAFLAGLHESLLDHGLPCISWGSRLSGRAGKACHTDRKIPALEKAVDALSDCFLLAQCRGLICTYSSLSVVSVFWADEKFSWTHFRGYVV